MSNQSATQTDTCTAKAAFVAFGPAIGECWQLGYHDGLKDLRAVGLDALRAFGRAAHDAARLALSNGIGDLTAQIKTADATAAQHAERRDAAQAMLLAGVGYHRVPLAQWLTAVGYFLLAAAAVAAEVPLASLTVGEAFGNLTQE